MTANPCSAGGLVGVGPSSTTGPPSVAHQASMLSASNSHTGGVHGGMTAHRSAACTALATQAAMASGEQPSSAAVRAAVAAATAIVAVVAGLQDSAVAAINDVAHLGPCQQGRIQKRSCAGAYLSL